MVRKVTFVSASGEEKPIKALPSPVPGLELARPGIALRGSVVGTVDAFVLRGDRP